LDHPVVTFDPIADSKLDSLSELLYRHRPTVPNPSLLNTKKLSRSVSASPRPSVVAVNAVQNAYDIEGYRRLLPANSTVSVLSVQFNEEMKMEDVKQEEEEEDEHLHHTHQRKHSLGSCLKDSENVMLNSAALPSSEVTTVKQEVEEVFHDEVNGLLDDTVVKKESESSGSTSDLLLQQQLVKKEELCESSGSTSDLLLQQQQQLSPRSLSKRVKKKSLTGWFKDLAS
jgi:hypothetical protein